MLKYSEGESKERDKLEIFAYDLHNLKSKSLMASIFLRFDERPMLLKMDIQKKGSIMIGIKSFIECFEKIWRGKMNPKWKELVTENGFDKDTSSFSQLVNNLLNELQMNDKNP